MKKTKNRLEYRMYGLVPYNISPIQQGIQFGHAVVEYGLEHGRTRVINDKVCTYTQWARNDKTFIILNGGTTSTNPESPGTLNYAESELYSMGVQLSTFHEPDLGDQLTAVVFLVDERVWDKEKYPEYDEFIHEPVDEPNYYFNLFGDDTDKILGMRDFLSRFKLA
jgi:hypothetical protein